MKSVKLEYIGVELLLEFNGGGGEEILKYSINKKDGE